MVDSKSFQQLDDASLGLLGGLKQVNDAISKTTSGFASAAKSADSLTAAGKRLSALATGGFFGLMGGTSVLFSLKEGFTALEGAIKSLRTLQGVDKGLGLANAISGTSELSDSFSVLRSTAGSSLDNIRAAMKATFDPATTRQWANEAVRAYADVEQAAYRLNTITNQTGERSIDRLNSTIAATRRLQEETNFVVSSVELLNTQYNVASGGFTSERDQLAVTGAGLNLSRAGFGNVEGSTDGVIKSLRALGESASEAELRAAQLFETTKLGLLTLDQLSGEAGGLASQAATLGVDFEEVMAALAALTTQGMSASEAATRITSLLNDLAAGGDAAQEALTGFTDAQGRQIQIGAGVLRDKGLTQLLEDLGTATGGQVPNIQRLFGNQMSQEALANLLNVGSSNVSGYADQLRNVDTNVFQEEGENRGRTIIGATERGQQRAQALVENIGSGVSLEGLQTLIAMNKEFENMSLAAAEASGAIIGFTQGVQRKVTGTIGVISAAVSPVIFTALFSVVTGKIGQLFLFLKKKVADGKREGESVLQFFAREINTQIKKGIEKVRPTVTKMWERAKVAFREFLSEVIPGLRAVEQAAANVNNQFNRNSPASAAPSRGLGASSSNVIDVVAEVIPDRPRPASNIAGLLPAATSMSAMVPASTAATAATAKTVTMFDKLIAGTGKATTAIKGLIGGGLKLLIPIFAKIIAIIGTAAIAGIAMIAAIKIISGGLQFLAASADKRANPAIKALGEQMKTLSENTDIASIKAMSDELNGLSSTAEKSATIIERLGEFVQTLGRRFRRSVNVATFQASMFEQAQAERDKVMDLLQNELSNELSAAQGVTITADTAEERQVKLRLDTGGILNADDIAIINKDIEEQVALAEELLNQRRASLEDYLARGEVTSDGIEAYENQVSIAEKELQTVQRITDQRKAQIAVINQIRTAESFNDGKDLNVQITGNLRKQVDAEIEYLADNFAEAFSGESIDPESFNSLVPNLQRALGAIQLQARVDPQSAIESLNQLQKIPNFNTLIFSDPNFRLSFSEAFKSATEEALNEAKNIEAIYTSSFNAISQVAGKSNLSLLQETQKAQITSINSQVAILKEELQAAGVPLQRQLELLAQISELESKRIAANKQLRDAQFEVAQSQLDQVKAIESAARNLSGSLSNFGNSTALGSVINASASQLSTAPQQTQLDAARQISDVDFEIRSLREERDNARRQLREATGLTREQRSDLEGRATGLDRSLREAASNRSERVENIRQAAGLEIINVGLERFQAQVTAATDTLQKTAEALKNTLQFIQRINQDAAANNESIIGLRQSISGFFGSTPMGELISQRFQIQSIENTRQLERSEAVNTAQQEMLDLAVLDAQLQLEQKGYENALVQTQLLSGVIDALTGRVPRTDSQSNVQNFLSDIPGLIQQQSGFIDQRRALNQRQMDYIPQQLENQLLNIERTSASSRLSALGGNLNAGNLDLILPSLESAINLNNQAQFRDINEGSLGSSQFQGMISSLNDSTRGVLGQDISALRAMNRANISTPQYSIGGGEGLSRGGSNSSVTVSPTIQVTIEGNGAGRDTSNMEQLVRTQVSQGLNAATSQIINEVRKL